MSSAAINAKITEAVTAYESGDLDTALTKLESAEMLMAALPDSTKDNTELKWDRESLNRLKSDIRRRQNAALGFRRQSMRFVRETES